MPFLASHADVTDRLFRAELGRATWKLLSGSLLEALQYTVMPGQAHDDVMVPRGACRPNVHFTLAYIIPRISSSTRHLINAEF